MDPGGIIIGAVGLVVAGLVIYVVTKQASQGGIDVNTAIGIRTKTTKSSQRAWEIAHHAALPWVSAAGLLAVATAVFSVTTVILVNTTGVSKVVPIAILIAGYVGLLGLMSLATLIANRAVHRSVVTGGSMGSPRGGNTQTEDRF